MQEEIASFISAQVRRSTESGDMQRAMEQLRRFVELEREAKSAALESRSDAMNVRSFPGLRALS